MIYRVRVQRAALPATPPADIIQTTKKEKEKHMGYLKNETLELCELNKKLENELTRMGMRSGHKTPLNQSTTEEEKAQLKREIAALSVILESVQEAKKIFKGEMGALREKVKELKGELEVAILGMLISTEEDKKEKAQLERRAIDAHMVILKSLPEAKKILNADGTAG